MHGLAACAACTATTRALSRSSLLLLLLLLPVAEHRRISEGAGVDETNRPASIPRCYDNGPGDPDVIVWREFEL